MSDKRIFPILLNVYLNTLLRQVSHQGHDQSQQQDKLAFILLSKVFKLSNGMPFQDQSCVDKQGLAQVQSLSDAQRDTLTFLKQSLL